MLPALHLLVHLVVDLFVFIIFVTVIASWLIAFGVVNKHNQFVSMVLQTCYGLTEPVLRPIRRFLPSFGGIDISPIVALFAVWTLESLLHNTVFEGVPVG